MYGSADGSFIYEGNWTQDIPNGKGKETYPDGAVYEGNFVNGRKEDANGVYRWRSGKKYSGGFKDGYM